MKRHLEEIINTYKEFASYLEKVDLDEMKKTCSREELTALKNELQSIKIKNVPLSISEIITEKKKEEYPELLGVHHYPILKEIDFLTETEKIKVDEHLSRLRIGNRVFGLQRVVNSTKKVEMIQEFLVERRVVELNYTAICPKCSSGNLSRELEPAEKNELEAALKDIHCANRNEIIEKYLEYICFDCDEEVDIYQLKKVYFTNIAKMIMEREKRLDNI